MSRFASPAAALSYVVLAGMGIVAILVAAGRIEETFVQRFVLPPVLLTLATAGLWEWRRRKRTVNSDADAEQ